MILFGQLLAILRRDQREVKIVGPGQTQALHEPALTCGIVEQVNATDDFSHPCGGIIHHNSKLVRIKVVASLQDEVTDFLMHVAVQFATQFVGEGDDAGSLGSQAPGNIMTVARHASRITCAGADAAGGGSALGDGVLVQLVA